MYDSVTMWVCCVESRDGWGVVGGVVLGVGWVGEVDWVVGGVRVRIVARAWNMKYIRISPGGSTNFWSLFFPPKFLVLLGKKIPFFIIFAEKFTKKSEIQKVQRLLWKKSKSMANKEEPYFTRKMPHLYLFDSAFGPRRVIDRLYRSI